MTDRHVLPPYSLRMPAELRERLEGESPLNKRSLNAEIIARLEASFETTATQPGTDQLSPLLLSWLAIHNAHPGSASPEAKARILTAVGRELGVSSADPAELLEVLSLRVIDHTLRKDLGL